MPTRENLDKIRRIQGHHAKRRQELQRRLAQAVKRTAKIKASQEKKESAGFSLTEKEERALRQIQFNEKLIREEWERTKDKEKWAQRLADRLDKEFHSRQIHDDRVHEATELIHKPFAGLDKMITID